MSEGKRCGALGVLVHGQNWIVCRLDEDTVGCAMPSLEQHHVLVVRPRSLTNPGYCLLFNGRTHARSWDDFAWLHVQLLWARQPSPFLVCLGVADVIVVDLTAVQRDVRLKWIFVHIVKTFFVFILPAAPGVVVMNCQALFLILSENGGFHGRIQLLGCLHDLW